MGARFVRLGISGFKSFADAATIDILPGLTGVVGPNGCGKSNVAEALRWVMGEANARALRGGEMDDIIFAGTAHRPSRNLAEVSITLEDDGTGPGGTEGTGGFPAPFTGRAELQVVRRIERGGGSAYRVNGREARARDVQTLFADLGSGARSSAMISQGRVGALVAARPEERRAVLEEAAGITGLHARRAEAESRLRAAEANLERAAERRAMLEGQSGALRSQGERAARYRVVSAELAEVEASLLALSCARAAAARAAAVSGLAQAEAALQRAEVAAVAAVAAETRLGAALPELRTAETRAQVLLERARMALEAARAEAARMDDAVAAARHRGERLRQDLSGAETALAGLQGVDDRLVAEAAALEQEAAAHPARLAAAVAEADAAAAALRSADADAAEAAARAAEATALAGAARQVLDQAEGRARRAQDLAARLQSERTGLQARLPDAARVLEAARRAETADGAVTVAREALEAAGQALRAAEAEARLAREGQAQADVARQRIAAEVEALREVLAVRDGEGWRPLLDDVVVEPGLEVALGAALGEELGASADPAAARHWRDLGPLPVARLPVRPLTAAVTGPAELGRALGSVGVVESEAQALAAQAGLSPGQVLVSPAGAVWRWDGYTIRAGTPTAAGVRLRQRNRLAALETELAAATAAAEVARARRGAADAASRAAALAEDGARAARRQAEAEQERARATLQALRTEIGAVEARLASLDDQVAAALPEREEALAALAASRQQALAVPEPAALRARADAARLAVAAARSRDAAAGRVVEALQRAEHARRGRLAVIGREREDQALRAKDLAERLVDLRARVAEAAAEQARLAAAPEQGARLMEAARSGLAEAEAGAEAALSARSAAERAAAAAREEARVAEGGLGSAREAMVRAEATLQAAGEALVAAEALRAERAGALPEVRPPTDFSAQAEQRTRARLQRLVRERDEMGPVNLRAELELAALEAEIAALAREEGEIGTAIARLRGSIGHLNREGRARLAAVFAQVDGHFQSLFGRMFGGGRAHLALVGSEDPLQAGLEIVAQPPGKKPASLSLLSGGEQALTALCLVFAVFRCNPAPICVLDEVDAPLDDANVERFCTLLSDMVEETATRFLVVTHHQLTMARMNRLYGVTMQERGVSRLLSVDLSGATQLVQAAAE